MKNAILGCCLGVFAVCGLPAAGAIAITNTADAVILFTNAHVRAWAGTGSAPLTQDDAIFAKGGTTTVRFVDPAEAPAGLLQFAIPYKYEYIVDWKTDGDWNYMSRFNWRAAPTTVDGFAYTSSDKTYSGNTIVAYSGSWYVPAEKAGTYSFYRNTKSGNFNFILDDRTVMRANGNETCVQNVSVAAGWHTVELLLGADTSFGSRRTGLPGFVFSAANIDKAAFQAGGGTAFLKDDATEGYKLSTAYAGAVIPKLCADGGNITVDLTHAPKNVRFAGSILGKVSGAVTNKVTFANAAADATLEFGCYYNLSESFGGATSMYMFCDWSKMVLPAGCGIRLAGSVFDFGPVPAGHTLSFGGCNVCAAGKDCLGTYADLGAEWTLPTGLFCLDIVVNTTTYEEVVDARTTINVPTGKYLRLYNFKSYDSLPPNGNYSTTYGYVSGRFTNDVHLTGGQLRQQGPFMCTGSYNGDVYGWGKICTSGWSNLIGFGGLFDVTNCTVEGGTATRNRYLFFGPEVRQEFTKFPIPSHCNQGSALVEYGPSTSGTAAAKPFRIGEVAADGASYSPVLNNSMYRQGAWITTYSNNTIRIGKLTGSGVHLGDAPFDRVNGGIMLSGSYGPAHFDIGSIADDFALFVSSNNTVNVTNVGAGVKFLYQYGISNGNNRVTKDCFSSGTLDIRGTCASSAVIEGAHPMNLPRRISGFTGTIRLVAPQRTWPWRFDLDFTCAEPNLTGCEGSGTLDPTGIPTDGTAVVNITRNGASPLKPGRYGLMTYTSCGDPGLFKNWNVTVKINGVDRGTAFLSREATGLWLDIPRGTMLLVR